MSHGVTGDYALLAEPTGLRDLHREYGLPVGEDYGRWHRCPRGADQQVRHRQRHQRGADRCATTSILGRSKFQDANVFLDEHANVTLAGIRGGDPWRLSRNPYECQLYLDIRTVPGQKPDQVKRALRSVLRQFADRHRMDEPSLEFIVTDPPLVIDQDLPIVTAIGNAQRTVMEQATTTFLRRPGSDAVHLTRYDVPCVQFGPGGRLHPNAKGRSMHAIGDHVLLDDVVLATRIYLETAFNLCNMPAVDIRAM